MESNLEDLLAALGRLDLLLERAVNSARDAYGPAASADPFRGLHIGDADAEHLLTRQPGAPVLGPEEGLGTNLSELTDNVSRLAWLKDVFGLSEFDVAVVLIALAPEVDLRYQKLYAYLQDDVTRKRPSVDLALNLLCSSSVEKLVRRAHFGSSAPLTRHALVHLLADPHQLQPPLLSHYLKLDEQITSLLLGTEDLDRRLLSFCRVVKSAVGVDSLTLDPDVTRPLLTLVRQAREEHNSLRLYFQGARGSGKCRVAEALANDSGASLLFVNLRKQMSATTDFAQDLRLVFREAWFRDAIVYFDGVDELRGADRSTQFEQLVGAVVADAGLTILSGELDWDRSGPQPNGIITVSFSIPDFAERARCWRDNLASAHISIEDSTIDALADRFSMTGLEIAEAVVAASNRQRWQHAAESAVETQVTEVELFSAARAQSGHDLATLAQKIKPIHTWNDIVLPSDTLDQLWEMCQQVTHRRRVLQEWGFNRKLSLGKGVNALFAGPSGTGKTMAAEIIANELGLDLYKIDLAGVVSKYIGETEKNLHRIFKTAENANAILFFDEADALFGKRSEVRDSHDRYANIEISYLLQKMEQYEGVAILATNLRQNLDDAFVRRLTFAIHFPFPDESRRAEIWNRIWPANVPRAADVDAKYLATQFKLSGGNIKNVALASAFLAAADGGEVTMDHLHHATSREYQKLGKTLSRVD